MVKKKYILVAYRLLTPPPICGHVCKKNLLTPSLDNFFLLFWPRFILYASRGMNNLCQKISHLYPFSGFPSRGTNDVLIFF